MQYVAPGLLNLLHGVVGRCGWGVPPVLLIIIPVPARVFCRWIPQLGGAMRKITGGAVPAVPVRKALAQARLKEGAVNG